MFRLHFITRGDREFGTGHLHRTTWLHEIFSAVPSQLEVWCNDSPEARGHFAAAAIHARFDAYPARAWLDARAADQPPAPGKLVCVLDKLDSYPETIQAMRAAGARVVLLDDYGPAQVEADLVINSLLAPLADSDEQVGRARVLSGGSYLALAPGVTRLRGIVNALNKALAAGSAAAGQLSLAGSAARQSGPVRGVLVSSGGSGHPLVNTLALAALSYSGFDGMVNVMPAPDRPTEVKTLGSFKVSYQPAGPGLHDLLAGSDLAILAGGISLYEAAFLGVPAVVIPVAEHQLATARKLAKAGCCVEAAEPALTMYRTMLPDPAAFRTVGQQLAQLFGDGELRGMMSRIGMQLFDGHGLGRTAEAILGVAG